MAFYRPGIFLIRPSLAGSRSILQAWSGFDPACNRWHIDPTAYFPVCHVSAVCNKGLNESQYLSAPLPRQYAHVCHGSTRGLCSEKFVTTDSMNLNICLHHYHDIMTVGLRFCLCIVLYWVAFLSSSVFLVQTKAPLSHGLNHGCAVPPCVCANIFFSHVYVYNPLKLIVHREKWIILFCVIYNVQF